MKTNAPHWPGLPLVVVAAAAALSAGCADEGPLGPTRRAAPPVQLATRADDHRAAALGRCDSLQAPAGSRLALHAYARGAQIYRWSGASWVFVEPQAVLFADAEGNAAVGTHYAGPTWRSVSGGTVVAAVLRRCTPAPDAIPWLLLEAVATDGPGVLQQTKFIQRVNTVGGKAPDAPGSFAGEVASVPYTAEYLFYAGE